MKTNGWRSRKQSRISCMALFLALCIGTSQFPAMAGEEGGPNVLPESVTESITHIYPFDGDAADWVKDGVAGEPIGGVAYEEGKYGQALCLDGTNGIKYPTDVLNDSGSFSISMWAYTQFPAGAQGRLISTGVWGDHTPGITMGLFTGMDENSGWAGMIYGMGKEEGASYFDWSWTVPYEQVYEAWAHVAAVFDKGENLVRVYINGEEKDRYSLESYNTQSSMEVFALGGHLSGDSLSDGYIGKVDELILFDKALSGDEVKVLSEAQGSLKPCRVKFEENGGEPVEDVLVYPGGKVSPADIHYGQPEENVIFLGWSVDAADYRPYDFSTPVTADMTLYAFWYREGAAEQTVMEQNLASLGAAHYYPFEGDAQDQGPGAVPGEEKGNISYGYGKFGRALYLDGKSYIQFPASMLKDEQSFSVSFWANSKMALGNQGRILSTGVWGANTPGFTLGLFTESNGSENWAGAIYGLGKADGEAYFDWSWPIAYEAVNNVWAQVTAVFDREEMLVKIYINGEEKDRYSLEGYDTDSRTEYFALGGHLDGGVLSESFTGLIDDLVFYEKALNPEQIQAVCENRIYQVPARKLKVTFEENGGENVPDVQVSYGEKVPASDIRYARDQDQWIFLGWSVNQTEFVPYDFAMPVTNDLTLYAFWYRKGSGEQSRLQENKKILDLTHYYPFEGDAEDGSGQTHGQEAGNISYGQGRYGRALYLDGQSYIGFPAAMLGDEGSFSVSFWANTRLSPGTQGRILSTGVWGDDTPGFTLGLFTEQQEGTSWAGAVYGVGKSQGPSYFDWSWAVPYESVYKTWAHVAAVFDKQEMLVKVYINGEEKDRYSLAGYNTDSRMEYFALGGHLEGTTLSESYTGLIDDLAFYSKALKEDQIRAVYMNQLLEPEPEEPVYRKSQDAQGTAHYYTFDDETARDVFSDGTDGQITGNAGFAEGLNGKALRLDGSSYVKLPADMLNDQGDFSISMWARPDIQDNTNARIFSTGVWGDNSPGAVLGLHTNVNVDGSWADAVYGVGRTSGESFFSWSRAVPYNTVKNQWVHLAGTYSHSDQKMKVYINGEEKASFSYAGYNTDSVMQYFALGGHLTEEGLMEGYKGLLDEVKIHDRTLTPEQVGAEYGRFRPVQTADNQIQRPQGHYRKSTEASGLAHYYSFDQNDARDYYEDGVDGILRGHPEFTGGVRGRGLKLDGGSCIQFPTEMLNDDGDFSITFYAKADIIDNANARIFSTGVWGENSPGVVLGLHTNVSEEGAWADAIYGVEKPGGDSCFSWSEAVDYDTVQDEWLYVAAVYDSSRSEAHIYLNGEEKAKFDYSGYSTDALPWDFGVGGHLTEQGVMEGFTGLIDELKIYDKVLSGKTIAGQYDSFIKDRYRSSTDDMGVAHYYSFDEQDASDYFENGTDGELAGSPEFVEGKYGLALKLDGKSYVKLPTAILAAPDSFSVSMWVNSQVDDNQQARLLSTGAWGENTPGIAIGVHTNVSEEGKWADLIYGVGKEGGDAYFDWSYAVEYETLHEAWAHVILICDAQEGLIKVYVNGEEKDRFEYAGYETLPDIKYFALGGHLLGDVLGEGFRGLLDEVSIYDRALTPEDVLLVSSGKMLNTVTFQANGGSPVEPVQVFMGNKAEKPVCSRQQAAGEEEWHLAAWSSHQEAYVPYDFDKPVTQDMTLHAMWRMGDQVTVSFEGYEDLTQVLDAGQKAQKPEIPAKEGYEFYKWYWDKAMTVKFDFDEPVQVDATLYPRWAQIGAGSPREEEKPEDETPLKEGSGNSALPWILAGAGVVVVIGGITGFWLLRRRKGKRDETDEIESRKMKKDEEG